MAGVWRAKGSEWRHELRRAQFILANWAITSLSFSLCAEETIEEFKAGEKPDQVCLLKRTSSHYADNELEMARVKKKRPFRAVLEL